jgi:cytochrome o ubiquinol oxidase subunit 2
MKKSKKILAVIITMLLVVVVIAGWYLHRHTVSVLQPAGQVGEKERNLIIFCALISVVVVLPVFSLLGYIAWRYREQNHRAPYNPDLEGNNIAETIWWLVPAAIIAVISVVTWNSSHALDPFKPLQSDKQALHIQVVALDWKWLFIYPGQNVASVREAAIPVGTPVDFEITSDTVMSSFWDPQLGGQIYAMPGMVTHLNLVADKMGTFPGSAANISGSGFADMTFNVKSVSQDQFNSWVASARHSPENLTDDAYANLAQPSTTARPAYYATVKPGLYDTIVMKYMMPTGGGTNVSATEGSQ